MQLFFIEILKKTMQNNTFLTQQLFFGDKCYVKGVKISDFWY